MLIVYLKIVLKDGLCLLLSVVDVLNHLAVFEENDAVADIDGMLQVMAAD